MSQWDDNSRIIRSFYDPKIYPEWCSKNSFIQMGSGGSRMMSALYFHLDFTDGQINLIYRESDNGQYAITVEDIKWKISFKVKAYVFTKIDDFEDFLYSKGFKKHGE